MKKIYQPLVCLSSLQAESGRYKVKSTKILSGILLFFSICIFSSDIYAAAAQAFQTGTWNTRATWAIFKTGTITRTSGSNTVTGTGTAFLTEFEVGDNIYTNATGAAPVLIGTILSINSNTSITLTATTGATGSNVTYRGNGVPASADDITIGITNGTINVIVNLDITPVTVNSISYAQSGGATYTLSIAANFDLSVSSTSATSVNMPLPNSNGAVNLLEVGGVFHTAGGITMTAGTNQATRFQTFSILSGGVATVAGNITVNNSPRVTIQAAGAGQLNFGGNIVSSATAYITSGTIDFQGNSVLNFIGSVAQALPVFSTANYANVYFNNSSASGATLTAALTAGKVTGDFKVESGKFSTRGSTSLTSFASNLNGNGLAISGNGTGTTLEVANGAILEVWAGSASSGNNFPSGFATVFLGETSTVEYNGTLAHTISAQNYGNLTVSGTRTTNSVTLQNSNIINIRGIFNQAATFTSGNYLTAGSTVSFTGASGTQSIPALNTAAYNNLTVNHTGSGISTGAAISVGGTLTLTSGILTTTSANLLTVTNTSAGAITDGSASAFVSGPLRRTLPANLASGSVYEFPVGKGGTYYPFTLTNPTTGGTGPVISVEAFNANAGGSADGTTLTSLSNTEYWSASIISGNYTNGSVSLGRQAELNTLNAVGRSSTQGGTYSSLNGTVSSTSINNSDNTGSTLGFFGFGEKFVPCTPPTITLGANPDICRGITSADLPYSATTESPDQYTIDFDAAAEAAGFADVSLTSLPASPISIVVPAAVAAGTYNATITVINSSTECSSIATSFTVTVSALPSAPTTGGNQTVCFGASSPNLSVTVSGGETADWYAESSEGSALATGALSYATGQTAAGTYTYYAEARNTSTGCLCPSRTAVTLTINALPSAPVSGGNQTATQGGTIPDLTVSVSGGETADWYTTPSGGSVIASGLSFATGQTAGGTYTYYAETRNTTTGCRSASRTAVTLTIYQQCGRPFGLYTTDVTATSATLHWDPSVIDDNFKIRYATVENPTLYAYLNISGGTEGNYINSASITNLFPGITYNIQVRTFCGSYSYNHIFTTSDGYIECKKPFGISASNITSTSATISWDPRIIGDGFRIRYAAADNPTVFKYVDVEGGSEGNYTTSANISNLLPETMYNVTVKTICAVHSSYSVNYTFTTLEGYIECGRPFGVFASNITATSATINWDPKVIGDGFRIRYAASDNPTVFKFINVEGGSEGNYTSSANISNLLPGTSYNVSVRTNCATPSAYSVNYTFTTPEGYIECGRPFGVFASNITVSSATINWDPRVIGDAFRIRYADTDNPTVFKFINVEGGSEGNYTTSANIPNLLPGTSYNVSVRTNCATPSAYSVNYTFTTSGNQRTGSFEEDLLLNEFNVEAYPNPANDVINLSINNASSDQCRILLTDAFGKVVKEEYVKGTADTYTHQLLVADLAQGIYLVIIIDGKNIKRIKIVKN